MWHWVFLVNCEECVETISQSKLIAVYLIPTVCMGEALLSWQAFGMWNKGSHIHRTVFVKIVCWTATTRQTHLLSRSQTSAGYVIHVQPERKMFSLIFMWRCVLWTWLVSYICKSVPVFHPCYMVWAGNPLVCARNTCSCSVYNMVQLL
jgi:hypothetical protein